MKNLLLKKWLMTCMIVTCFGIGTFAESLRKEGHVKEISGKPIPGATILVKGSGVGTVTDANGKFVILLPPNSVLVISMPGYITKEVKLEDLRDGEIILEEDTEANTLFLSESEFNKYVTI